MPSIREGVYVKFLKDQEKKIVFSSKSPKELDKNYVGIEIEFFCDATKDDLGLKLYDANLGKNVTLKGDSSIQPPAGKFAHELCVIAKDGEYKDVLKKACEVLSKVNAEVNKTCGMHVHLDMRNRDVEKAYQNLVSAQGILYKMNPKSRMERYAKKIQERDFKVAKNGDRYFGINPTAYGKYQTIEVRIHSGTIDYNKISNWIEILLKVATYSKKVVKNFAALSTFKEAFEVEDEKLLNYMTERMEKFKTKNDGIVEVNPEAEVGVA